MFHVFGVWLGSVVFVLSSDLKRHVRKVIFAANAASIRKGKSFKLSKHGPILSKIKGRGRYKTWNSSEMAKATLLIFGIDMVFCVEC